MAVTYPNNEKTLTMLEDFLNPLAFYDEIYELNRVTGSFNHQGYRYTIALLDMFELRDELGDRWGLLRLWMDEFLRGDGGGVLFRFPGGVDFTIVSISDLRDAIVHGRDY